MSNVISGRMDERVLRANIRRCYAIRCLMCSFSFCVPTIVLFWQEHGLSISDVTLLEAIFAAVMAASQLPTGYFADLVARRSAIVLGSVFMLAGAAIYCVAGGFWGFVAAECMLGIAMAFVAGADQALLYDSLAELDEEERFAAVWGQASSVAIFSMASGCLVGGALTIFGLRSPFYVTLACTIVQLWIAIGLAEPRRRRITAAGGHVRELAAIVQRCGESRQLAWTLGFAAIVAAWTQSALWFYQPYFRECGVDPAWFGAIFAAFNIVAATSSWFAHRIVTAGRMALVCSAFVLLLGLSYLLLGSLTVTFGFCFVFLQQIVRGFSQVMFAAEVSRLAGQEVRATVSSLQSLLFTVLYVALLLPAGWIAESAGLSVALLLLGGSVLVVGAVALLLRPKVQDDMPVLDALAQEG